MRINRISLKARLWLLTFVSVVSLAGVAVFSLHQLRETMLEDRRTKLRHLVESAMGTLAHFAELERKGMISRSAAQHNAAEALRTMRYDGTEYFWINDLTRPVPRMVMHPTLPALEGRILNDQAYHSAVGNIGANGVKSSLKRQNLFVAFADVIEQSGRGYVLYEWPKPRADGTVSTQLHTKLSYVAEFKPWGWVIGSGIYLDDVDLAYSNYAGIFLVATVGVLGLMTFVATMIRRGIIRELGAEPAIAAQLARDLSEQKIAADAANKAKSEFLANMSHEIRTPMNSVIGMAHLALRSGLDLRQRDYVEKILIAGQHLLGIIDSILDFSKIEAGQMQLDVHDYHLRQIADKVQSLLRGKAEGKGLDLVIGETPLLDEPLRGDPLRLGQVLINLVGNAIKFSSSGEIRVDMRGTRHENQWRIRIEVHDQGIGLSQEQIDRLFVVFQQADNSTTRKFGGTGLGLAISKHLVNLMGGEIGVESEPGKGSTFWFTIAAAFGDPRPAIAAEHSEEPIPTGAENRRVLAGRRLLVAEDNVFNQQVASELLRYAGAKVSLANNGREAVEAIRRQSFDAVLMDLQMPEMDGIEATRIMRADPATRDTLIVAMTANAGEEDRQRCLDAGMDDFVTKPFEPERLFHTLLARIGSPRDDAIATAPIAPGIEVPPAESVSLAPSAQPVDQRNADIVPAPIDLSALAKNLGNDGEKLRRFAGLFVRSTRESIEQAIHLVDEGDLKQLSELGHRLKSSSRGVGALRLADLCLRLENMQENNETQVASALLDAVRDEFVRVESAINDATRNP